MLRAVKVLALALLAPLLTSTTNAIAFHMDPEQLLRSAFDLTRSGAPRPPCQTPEGQQGVCGSVTTCEAYLPLLKNLRNSTVLNFFKERVCRRTAEFIHVCCPPNGSPLGPGSTPGHTSISFNQQPPIISARPSQRPNARQPAFSEQDNSEDDKEEFLSPPILSTHPPPATIRPVPPPRPSFLPTTTTRAPSNSPSIASGFILSADREPPSPNSHNSQGPATQSQDAPPTEPPVPPVLPAERECGTTSQGGTGTMPWVVAVGVVKEEFQVFCGGALISNQHVIVAAHCLHAPPPTHVRLGDPLQPASGVDVSILRWNHPGYNHATRDNDLALLTLNTPVSYTDNIRPVCLPFPYRLDGFQGQEVQVVGWGGGGKVEAGIVEVVGLGQCRKAYNSPSLISNNKVAPFSRPDSSSSSAAALSPRTSSSVVVDRRHLCGSPAPLSSSSCLSDHGAPLFYYDDHGTTHRHFLVGVSSLGEGCMAGPGLYTRVGAFLPWLSKQLSTVEASTPSPGPSPALHRGSTFIFRRRG